MYCRSIVVFLTALVVLVGCGNDPAVAGKSSKPMIVNVSIANGSSNDLDQVELIWNGPYVPGGAIPSGSFSTSVGTEWANVTSAKLKFLDEKTRGAYAVDVSLIGVDEKLRTGKLHDVTIRILAYDKAEVVCAPAY